MQIDKIKVDRLSQILWAYAFLYLPQWLACPIKEGTGTNYSFVIFDTNQKQLGNIIPGYLSPLIHYHLRHSILSLLGEIALQKNWTTMWIIQYLHVMLNVRPKIWWINAAAEMRICPTTRQAVCFFKYFIQSLLQYSLLPLMLGHPQYILWAGDPDRGFSALSEGKKHFGCQIFFLFGDILKIMVVFGQKNYQFGKKITVSSACRRKK